MPRLIRTNLDFGGTSRPVNVPAAIANGQPVIFEQISKTDTYPIPANVLRPQAVGPGITDITTTNGIKIGVADFDGVTVETANFSDIRPFGWDGSNPTAKFQWMPGSGATAGNVVAWEIAITALNENDSRDVTPTYVTVTDTVITAQRDHTTASTPAIPVQGTLLTDSRLQIWVRRDPNNAADNMAQDARLVSAILTFTLS